MKLFYILPKHVNFFVAELRGSSHSQVIIKNCIDKYLIILVEKGVLCGKSF